MTNRRRLIGNKYLFHFLHPRPLMPRQPSIKEEDLHHNMVRNLGNYTRAIIQVCSKSHLAKRTALLCRRPAAHRQCGQRRGAPQSRNMLPLPYQSPSNVPVCMRKCGHRTISFPLTTHGERAVGFRKNRSFNHIQDENAPRRYANVVVVQFLPCSLACAWQVACHKRHYSSMYPSCV